MAIISRTGVYLGHFWETMVFDIDDIWLKGPPVKKAEEWFKHNVLDWIRLGDAGGQTALCDFGKKISKGSPVKCYMIIPTSTDKSPEMYKSYQDKWKFMKRNVGELIPELMGETQWMNIEYEALDDIDPKLQTTLHGRVLLKYDPDHEGKERASLWVEGDPTDRHGDQW